MVSNLDEFLENQQIRDSVDHLNKGKHQKSVSESKNSFLCFLDYRSPSVSGQSGSLFYNIFSNIGEILREIYMGFYWEFGINLD